MSDEPEIKYEVRDPETDELLEAMLEDGTSVLFDAGVRSFEETDVER